MSVERFFSQSQEFKKVGDVGLDKNKITIQLPNEIDGSSPISLIGLDNYEKYYENTLKTKKEIYKLLGDKTRKVFEIEPEILTEEAEKNFREEYRKFLKKETGITKDFFEVVNLITESELLKNRYKDGRKFTKALSSTSLDKTLVKKLVLGYSMIKNSFIVPKSYFVISIDPYDFLTMGTGRGWKTCYSHAGGSHFTGALSNAYDSVSFLTFFTTDVEDYSKKLYRRLGAFSDNYDGVMLSTQYPYKNSSFEEFTLKKLNEVFFNQTGIVNKDKKVKVYKNTSSQVFNDFVSSSSSKRESLYLGAPRAGIIYYGAMVKCLSCESKKASNESPFCEQCADQKKEKERKSK